MMDENMNNKSEEIGGNIGYNLEENTENVENNEGNKEQIFEEIKEEKIKSNYIKNIIIAILLMLVTLFVFQKAPNYIKDFRGNDTGVIINYTDVTNSLKEKVLIEDDIVYLSMEDIKNFYDEHIYYDEKYDRIITGTDTMITTLYAKDNNNDINGITSGIRASAIRRDNTFYIPFSELEDVYNVKTEYHRDSNVVVLESLQNKKETATSTKNNRVMYLPTVFSKVIEKLEEGESVTIVQDNKDNKNGYIKIRTQKGNLGFVKEKSLLDKRIIRENSVSKPQIDGKINLVWEYFSEYGEAPHREGTKIDGINVVSPSFFYLEKRGKGNLLENVGTSGKQYIEWAHQNGYKVWPIVSNDSMQETTSEIMNDYELRQKLINKIVSYIKQYNLDGVNIDFENMKEEDKDMFSRFIIELAPRLRNIGKVVSVDVTAPDGSPDWSLCFDRNVIADAADYIIFMAYDQTSESSETPGTNAGYDWVELNINKFLKQEEVNNEKIILGIPFYTRLWKESDGQVSSSTVRMKGINSVIPSGVEAKWDEKLKQNYVEYEEDGALYKMWIEDEKSIQEKLKLMNRKGLAGAGFWVKDFEPDGIWNVISQEIYK